MSTPDIILGGALLIFGVGLYGLLITRNLVKVVVALQILVKAALLALIAAGQATGRLHLSQSLAMTVIVADTVVAVIGLALAVQVKRVLGTMDLTHLTKLKG